MSHLVNTVNDKNEKTLPTQFLTIPDSPNHIDRNQKSWYLGDFNQDSIPPQYIELDQSQTLDKLASFHFNEIEFEHECEPEFQFCDSVPDLDSILKPTLIPVPINLEHNPVVLNSHIQFWEKNVNLNSLIWTQLLNQNRLSNLNLI